MFIFTKLLPQNSLEVLCHSRFAKTKQFGFYLFLRQRKYEQDLQGRDVSHLKSSWRGVPARAGCELSLVLGRWPASSLQSRRLWALD